MGSRFRVWVNLCCGQAVRALVRQKLRSALTALGIMIGIAATVMVVTIGTAGSKRAEEQLHKLGDTLVWVEAGSRNVAGVRTGSHGTTSLTIEDARAILSDVPLITSMSPQVDGSVQAVYGNRNWNTRYRGITPEYLDIRRWEFAKGAAFTQDDVDHGANVCVIGQTTREQLFADEDPVGKTIRVNTQLFEVVGLLAPKGQSATGQDQDDTLMMPFTTAQTRIKGKGYAWLDDIMCAAESPQAVDAARTQVIALLRQRHQIRPDEDEDFNIRRPDELIKAQIESSKTLALLLLSVACISLLVGGIGIMNVMLASVAQRTREIGLRLAIGAKSHEVHLQFLGEAVVLSLFGGLLGVVFSVVGSALFERAVGWPMPIPPQAIVLAGAFSIAVGVFFGFYPAWKAARMDPISALRHE